MKDLVIYKNDNDVCHGKINAFYMKVYRLIYVAVTDNEDVHMLSFE